MRRRSNSPTALLATLLSAACYVVPSAPPVADPTVPAASAYSLRGDAPCERDEAVAVCDLGAGWSPAPRGAWEACSRPA